MPANLIASADRCPLGHALLQADQAITYAQLVGRAAGVAARLRDSGVQAGERVGLLLEASPAYVYGYYGILGANAVVVPFSTTARAPEIERWLRHADACRLILDESHPEAGLLRESCSSWLQIIAVTGEHFADGTPWLQVEDQGRSLTPPANPDSLASITYTSGSTGQPKGVMLSHRNLAANVAAILGYLQLSPADRIVTVMPLCYAYGNSVLQTHLTAGGAVYIENTFAYPHRTVERMVAVGATGVAGVPPTFAMLMQRVRVEDYDLRSIRYITAAGAPMPAALIDRVQRAFPGVPLYIMYGQTEATSRLTFLPPEKLSCKRGSVGIPISGVAIQVRDSQGERLGPGEVGEVFARGPNVMLGYWKDQQGSRDTLRDGWLATGDLGYLDAEGFLYLVGRKTDMIKTGGYRVSPLDVEDVLTGLAEVAEAAVVGVPDEVLGQAISAFVVLRPGACLGASDLQKHCRERLAAYKVPKRVALVGSLPRNAAGKVQRFRLA